MTDDSRIDAGTPPGRGIFCNRTLNLRSVQAIGYDMDYTLVHYHSEAWEQRAFEHVRRRLADRGWPVADAVFDPRSVIRGLIIDRELGNLVKANRFGYVKAAAHGTRALDFDAQRRTYARTQIDLGDERWVFLNALFSLSEAAMYLYLVDRLDARAVPEVIGYADLHDRVAEAMDATHLEGELKEEITAAPEHFVDLDPDAPRALLDQRAAGKRLVLITNSDWPYTDFMMSHAYDRFLPAGMRWRDLFNLVIVWARKPDFFDGSAPIYEVVSDDGLLRACPTGLHGDGIYAGGNAKMVERYLGLDGDEVLFVGDHVYADVHVSKRVRRWRTALILRELEMELAAVDAFTARQTELNALMATKSELETQHARVRLHVLRAASTPGGGARGAPGDVTTRSDPTLIDRVNALRGEIAALDEVIAPLARAAGEVHNARWGLLMRTGNDKSHLAYQIERHADIYTSRVANFLYATPFAYFRSPRGSLPHDPG
jgi:5'-nucleotidase